MLRNLVLRGLRHSRSLRTLRNARPQASVDIEAKLMEYPEKVRKDIIAQLNSDEYKEVHGQRVSSEEFLAGLVAQTLALAETPQKLDSQFWESVRGLSRVALKSKNENYIPLFVELFEAAKQTEDPQERVRNIYLAGNYIYRLKKVRLDPINEIEFLDSLVAFKRPFLALKLWKSRVGREDVKQYAGLWEEVGILYHLEAGLLASANAMALNSEVTNAKIATYLLDAWIRQLARNSEPEKAKAAVEHWFAFLMKNLKRSDTDLLNQATLSLIAARQWPMAAEMVPLLKQKNMDNSSFEGAFTASICTRTKNELDFMPLFNAIAEKDPDLATSSAVGACMSLSFAKMGDAEMAIGILEEMKQRGKEIPLCFQLAIYRELESRGASDSQLREMRKLGANAN